MWHNWRHVDFSNWEADTRANSLVQLDNLHCNRDMTFYPLKQYGPLYWNISFQFLAVAWFLMHVKNYDFVFKYELLHYLCFPDYRAQLRGICWSVALGYSLIALRQKFLTFYWSLISISQIIVWPGREIIHYQNHATLAHYILLCSLVHYVKFSLASKHLELDGIEGRHLTICMSLALLLFVVWKWTTEIQHHCWSLGKIFFSSALWAPNCITKISARKELEAFWCMDFVYCVMQGQFTGWEKACAVAKVNMFSQL